MRKSKTLDVSEQEYRLRRLKISWVMLLSSAAALVTNCPSADNQDLLIDNKETLLDGYSLNAGDQLTHLEYTHQDNAALYVLSAEKVQEVAAPQP